MIWPLGLLGAHLVSPDDNEEEEGEDSDKDIDER